MVQTNGPNKVAQPRWSVSNLLGISLLKEGTPELILGTRVAAEELAIDGGQEVVHYHLHPAAKHPETKPEHS